MGFRGIYKYIRQSRFQFPVIEDWITSTSAGFLGWVSSVANGGASTIANGEQGHYGIASMSTGTTANATGYASLNLGAAAILLGSRDLDIIFSNRVPVLSTVTIDYYLMFGFGDNTGPGNTNTDGAYFLYDRPTYGDNWQAITANNGVRTIVDTGVAVTANTWNVFEIKYKNAVPEIDFVINGVVVATINTNIPTGTGRVCAPLLKIHKITSTNTARTLQCDWCIIDIKRQEV